MLRFLKDWKFILIITFLILFTTYLLTVRNQEIQTPSNGWSRQVFIDRIKVNENDNEDLKNNLIALPLESENLFIVLWKSKDMIKYYLLDDKGNIISSNQVKLNIESDGEFNAVINDGKLDIYGIKNKTLKKYTVDWKTNNIINEEDISKEVYKFRTNNNLIVFTNKDSLIIKDIANDKIFTVKSKPESFQITLKNNIYHIAFIEKNNSGYRTIKYINYDSTNFNEYDIKEIYYSTNGKIDIEILKDKINIIVYNYDKRYDKIFANIYSFKEDESTNVEINKVNLYMKGYMPYIVRDHTDENIKMLIPTTIVKGSKTITTNLMLYDIENNKILKKSKLLTKTNHFSSSPNYFTLNSNKYLVWADLEGKFKSIYLSSDNSSIIKKSKILRLKEWFYLILDMLSSLIFVLYMSVAAFIFVSSPVLLLIFIRYLSSNSFDLNKMHMKLFYWSLIPYIISKIIYIKMSVFTTPNILSYMPYLLKNKIILTITLLVLTLVSLYCTLNFVKKNDEREHFLLAYVFFSFIDIILMSLIFFTYISSYMMFGYVLNI